MVPLNNMFHVTVITDELLRIADSLLKAPLGLQLVERGDITTLPASQIPSVVPLICVEPVPATTNRFGEMPKVNFQTYSYRFCYVRLIGVGENIVKKSEQDVTLIMNTYADKIYLPDITNLPIYANILWQNIPKIEWRPPEDAYVQQIHADLTAIVFTMDVEVKTRRQV